MHYSGQQFVFQFVPLDKEMEHFLQWLEVIISTGNLMNFNRQIIPVVSTFSYTALFSLGDLQDNSKMVLYVVHAQHLVIN